MRFPVVDRGYPNAIEVNEFVDFVKRLPQDAWLHFHCAGGQGRTTLFLCVLEMMLNPAKTSTEIMRQQEILGGVNLYDPEGYYIAHPEKIKDAQLRLKFFLDFHQ